MFSNNRAVNVLAAARIFLFAARDVWFVVGAAGLPAHRAGLELLAGRAAFWPSGSSATAPSRPARRATSAIPTGARRRGWRSALALLPAGIAGAWPRGADAGVVLVAGLIVFGVVFALNSAVHSYLILAYADGDKVAMNVGFYYMANAGGRLAGTVLSGALYQWQGLEACLWASAAFVLAAGLLSRALPHAVTARRGAALPRSRGLAVTRPQHRRPRSARPVRR